ncbi:class I SAM-dependent methyltransferase [Falsirhodobacter sp. 1013]|uniref:class I SAM-dependent methyltransferase n=1 Tax=Falsirhodobacter sp. 1013 TaxID=3417566 RepID=UPI003EBCDB80
MPRFTRDISVHDAPVVEFGPGTGVFTRELIGRGIEAADLTLVEYRGDFVALLRDRFPGARILHADAARISATNLFPVRQAGAVVSGLGLLSMPPPTVKAILRNAFECMRADGNFYQFTYGFRCPVSRSILTELGLQARRIGGTMRNLPPASVYRISRPTPFLYPQKSIHP